jgi:hypothetical protein
MPENGHQFGQFDDSRKNPPQALSEELRGWIERVIVPALVSKFLQETGFSRAGLMDNAQLADSTKKEEVPASQTKRR